MFINIFEPTIINPMTLSQELRQTIIEQAEQGKQYRQISKELNVSVGSIANIIKNHKTGNGHEQPSPSQAQNPVVSEPNQKLGLQKLAEIDFDDEPYDVITDPNADYDERYDGVSGERRLNYQYTNHPMFPPRRLEILDTDYDNRVVTKTRKEIEENSEESYQSQPRISDSEDSSLGLGIDWDSNHQARFVKWVMYEKKRRT
jgi:transposase